MRNCFGEYYPISDTDKERLWENALFTFDTNILLNLYRYSYSTRNEFKNALETVKDKMWLPHQVVKEYQQNRLSVISDQKLAYKSFNEKIIKLINELNNNNNPFLSEKLHDEFESFLPKIQGDLETNLNAYDSLIFKDDIQEYLTNIFDEKVGAPFTEEEMEKILKSGKDRYKDKIPPGYKDRKKPEPNKYGDLILWQQIIKKSKQEQKPVILILNDKKEDWWLIHEGKTLSPRPELIKEFKAKTEQTCYFYKPFQFLKYLNKYYKSSYTPETIREVETIEHVGNEQSNQIKIELILKTNSYENDVGKYIKTLEAVGYQVAATKISENKIRLTLYLPNIPDLERRFRKRYLFILDEYNLILINYKSDMV